MKLIVTLEIDPDGGVEAADVVTEVRDAIENLDFVASATVEAVDEAAAVEE